MPEADVQKDLIRKYNTQLAEAKKDQDSIDVEKNTGKVFMQQISGKDILSQTVRVPYDYIIYGSSICSKNINGKQRRKLVD